MTHASRTSTRPGFTLVELLVTIGIITILAAVLIVALGNIGVKARQEATAALIKKVSNQVQERMEALDRLKSQPQWVIDAKKSITSPPNPNPQSIPYPTPNLIGLDLNQAKVLLFKYRMALSFPQSFNEFARLDPAEFIRMIDPQYALGLSVPAPPIPPAPPTLTYLDYTPWTTSHTTHRVETESSAILYYILTHGKALGVPTVDPGEYKTSEVADTDGDGLLEFVDGWGKPLRFYRWPTRLFCPTGSIGTIDRTANASWIPLVKGLPAAATPDPLAKDQDDPTLVLVNSNPNSTVSQLFTEALYHTPRTYHDFLIVSSGPDGQKIASADDAFGLWPPTDQYSAPGTLNAATNQGYLAKPKSGQYDALTDNITNRNR